MDYNFLWGVIALACGAVMLVYGASMFRVVLLAVISIMAQSRVGELRRVG